MSKEVRHSPLGSFVARLNATIRNGLELSMLGGLGDAAEAAPFEVLAEQPVYRLRRYFPDDAGDDRPAIVLVPPLMLSAEVFDVAPPTSAVRTLHALGIAPWVVDFGSPEHEEGGLGRTLADHVLAVSDAIDRVRAHTGRDVHVGGYSQGGMFCYQAAAYRRSAGVASVVVFGSPVDVRKQLPPGPLGDLALGAFETIEPLLSRSLLFVPAWLARLGFQMMDPVKEVQSQLEFLGNLYDREKLLKREAQRRFLAREGWVAYPGPALRDLIEQVVGQNRMLAGGLVIGDRTVTLADITCPVLAFIGEVDDIAPAGTVRAIRKAAPRSDVYELAMDAGHFGLVVGSKSAKITWPGVAGWMHWREGRGELPAAIHPIEPRAAKRRPPRSDLAALGETAELAWNAGFALVGGAFRALADRSDVLTRLAEAGLPQVVRLARLAQVKGDTRISMGLVLAEQARAHPERTFFLFEDRAYPFADAERRIDAVVRGLISVGVRVGERVGVLMKTRPSAIAVITALSRIGAIAVLHRPDGPLEAELELGGVEHLVADPESGERAREAFGRDVLVLGGGGRPRALAAGLVDLERIDPSLVALPGWYEPNPGRADDVAAVFFSGGTERLRAREITNARWALGAFGASSVAALTTRDTVYCATPLFHPTGLLVCVGGALAAGVRLAVAARFDAATFWEEVRRYGATVVFYKGAMLHELVDAPPNPAERHHPVRLFAGSGMPRNVWRRLVERFGPVTVSEIYTSIEAQAALANLTGKKVGSLGRPFPGTAEVEIATWDPRTSEIAIDSDGFARRAPSGETGVLLARVSGPRSSRAGQALRSVFAKGDAWRSTDDLFRRDEDGDYWIVEHLDDLIVGPDGPIPSLPIEDALGELDAVSLAVAYGGRPDNGGATVPMAAVALRRGRALSAKDLDQAVGALPEASRPRIVRILDELPMTAGYRPLKAPLRAEGLRLRKRRRRGFLLENDGATYRALAKTDLERWRS